MDYKTSGYDRTTYDLDGYARDYTFPVAPPETADLSNGLTNYWNLDEATGTRVASVGGVNLTESGGATGSATGIHNDGPNFTAATVLHGNVTLTTPSSMTVSVWVKASAGLQTLRWGTFVIIYSGASIGCYISSTQFVAGPAYNGTWQHVLIWGDGTTGGLSINGGAPTIVTFTPVAGGLQTLTLSDGDEPVTGVVDELGIWDRPLNATERALLYNGGAGTFYPF